MQRRSRRCGLVKIRFAKEEDIPQITDIGRQFYSFANFESFRLGFDEESVRNLCLALMKKDPLNGCVIVADKDEQRIVGTIAGIIAPFFLNHSQMIVTEHWWWVEKDFRGKSFGGKGLQKHLLDALEWWARKHNASALGMVALGGVEKERALKRYYGRLGFRHIEAQFIKEL